VEDLEKNEDQSSSGQTTTTDHDVKTSTEEGVQEQVRVLSRRGDVGKCPICGTSVDEEAYHCPSCRNYFCFHCRARLISPDIQLQCVNQHCDYYGKLVCDVCDPQQQRDEPPNVYAEPEDGYWPGWLLLSVTVGACVWFFSSILSGVLSGIGLFLLGGGLLHMVGVNIFGWQRMVEHPRKSTFHSCISCGEIVKQVRLVK
jgi:hypothetical protein